MNDSFCTLGSLRLAVFRLLDEYSCNGEENELFSGAVGDIDKRFINAANSAIRLVYLSCQRTLTQKNVCFDMPHILMELCDFSLSEKDIGKSIFVPDDSEAVSFDYCGCGTLGIYDKNDELLCETELNSPYGVFSLCRQALPDGAYAIGFCTDGYIKIKKLRAYSASGALRHCDSALLPDGKRLFCMLGDTVEIVSAAGTKYGRKTDVPTDIFELEDGILSCEEKYAGEYTVSFCRYPEPILESSSDDTRIELSPALFSAVAYAVAAELCSREDAELYTRLTYKYREMLANIYPAANLHRKNSFFAGGLFGRRKKVPAFRG